MIHYHGTPITPREKLYDLAGRHFCVSFADPRDVKVCHEIGQSVMLDNGAYSFWTASRSGASKHSVHAKTDAELHAAVNEFTQDYPPFDWTRFYDWAEKWLDYPTTWAVIPDVIDGDEDANDRLLVQWFQRRMPKGAPVWHLHESLDRLQRLAAGYERVCFGSSGAFCHVGTDAWHRRVCDAFDAIADSSGRVPWVHMLRGLALAGSHYPFASADSTNAARNHAGSWQRRSRPLEAIVAEIDGRQCPGRWQRVGTQTTLTEATA